MSRLVAAALLAFAVGCGTARATPPAHDDAVTATSGAASQAEVTLNAPGLL